MKVVKDAARHSAPPALTPQVNKSILAQFPASGASQTAPLLVIPPRRPLRPYRSRCCPPQSTSTHGKSDDLQGDLPVHDQCSSLEGSSFHPRSLYSHHIRQLCVDPAPQIGRLISRFQSIRMLAGAYIVGGIAPSIDSNIASNTTPIQPPPLGNLG